MHDYPAPFIAMLAAFVAIGLGVIGYFVYNVTRPTVTRRARVTGKRSVRGSSTQYCTFEFEDGQRQEYTVSLDTFASLTVNDAGYLDTKGTVFWGFRRPPAAGHPASREGASLCGEPFARIREALARGRKVEAVRLYRECTAAGLAEAKAAVDRLEAELRAAGPDTSAGPDSD
jgi:hypothetical protein